MVSGTWKEIPEGLRPLPEVGEGIEAGAGRGEEKGAALRRPLEGCRHRLSEAVECEALDPPAAEALTQDLRCLTEAHDQAHAAHRLVQELV
jgi:hypothetical protein